MDMGPRFYPGSGPCDASNNPGGLLNGIHMWSCTRNLQIAISGNAIELVDLNEMNNRFGYALCQCG